MTNFTLNSKKCLVQAEVFKTRAFIAAIRGLAKTINSELHENAAKEFRLADRFMTLMDDASDNALKFSTEEDLESDYLKALKKIASCEKIVDGDVVDIAQKAIQTPHL